MLRTLRSALLHCSLLACLGASCANMPMTRTGYLATYDDLEPRPEHTVWGVPDGIDLYESPALHEGGYDAVLIEPVVYRPGEGRDYDPSNTTVAELSSYFEEKLEERLGESFAVVHEARPGTMRVRAAFTAVDPSNVFVNVITVILLVPVDMGGISGEVEVTDAMTGERLAAMTLCREGTPFLFIECFFRHGHAHHGLKKWAGLLEEILAGEE